MTSAAAKRNPPAGNPSDAGAKPPVRRDFLTDYANHAGLSAAALRSLRDWLAEQLVADEYAKLGQGGHTETQVPLRRVFIDLPTMDYPSSDAPHGGGEFFLQHLMAFRPIRLNTSGELDHGGDEPDFLQDGRRREGSTRNIRIKRSSQRGGILLIGGPGQGKSTLVQLACQLNRAALLQAHENALPSNVHDVLKPFRDATSKDESADLKLPETPHFPLRIVLPDAATWLSKSLEDPTIDTEVPVLLQFIASQASARKAKLEAKTLAALIATMPFLLLLDGFDEVGAVEDRVRIVTTTRQMLAALGHKAHAVVVATTRPQGYAGELAHLGVSLTTKYLAQLDTMQALSYASKLVQAKIASADERERTLKRITTAAQETVTSRLLRTPLQVTILMALVQHGGGAPSERWNLFKAYFDFAYRREIERDTYASKLLRDRRSHIQAIHTRVALILQAEGENAGGAAARISRDRLQNIVDIVLAEDEVDDSERAELVLKIIDAAEKRLVFLVEPEPGRFGFEIRSLQEFMAAWALTEGRETVTESRLLQVAKAPLFRHVVLFMASKLFCERSALRDVLADRICGALDSDPSDSLSRATKAGGLLALDVLEEGSALLQPKRARSLMDRAIGLLDLPPGPEHARLARVATEDTVSILQTALETRLARSSPDPVTAAWVCILEATNDGRKWAVGIAERFWPHEKKCHWLFDACVQGQIRIGHWIVSKIEAMLESFTPEKVLSFSDFRHRRDADHGVASWIGVLSPLYHTEAKIARFSGIDFYYRRLPTTHRKQQLKRAIASMPDFPDNWRAWESAMRFSSDPSAALLADTLRIVGETLQRESWMTLAERMSWPLMACLHTAETIEDLGRLEAMLRRGDLGDSDDWYKAEEKWQDGGSLQPAIIAVAEGTPWKKETLSSAAPLAGIHFINHGKRFHGSSTISSLLNHASHAIATCSSTGGRDLLATLSINLLWHLPTKAEFPLDEALEWLRISKKQLGAVPSRRPKHIPQTWWLRLVNDKRPAPSFLSGDSANIAREYMDNSDSTGLLFRLMQSVVHGPPSEVTADLRVRLVQVVTSQTYQDPAARADAGILRVWLGAVSDVEVSQLFSDVSTQAKSDTIVWYHLVQALRNSEAPSFVREELLLKCYSATSTLPNISSYVVETMRAVLQARRSGLGSVATWDRLELPLPHPMVPVAAGHHIALPEKPVILHQLHVHRIRGLHDLRLQFELPKPGQGQWILLLGPNGSGKTTLLRSVALAVRNLQDPKIWPKGTFATQWLEVGASGEARISIQLGDHDEHITRIRSSGSETFSQQPKQDQPRLFPVFAYGCRRGSALGGAARAVDLGDDDGPEIATLFDEGAPLIHAETWLIQWDGDAHKTPRSKAIFGAIISALRDLLAVHSIEIREQKVWVSESGGAAIPFRSLSDGYITSAGWFLDLLARWIHLAERSGVLIDETFMKNMTGLVLLDEIDLHLHPKWQIESIGRTRRLLPRMSFVVTTHNPLTLVGANPEEIWVLSVEEAKIRADRGVDVPMLLTGGQIYNRYFGIQDIYPHELGKALQRFGFLSGYALRNDIEQMELQSLREQLSAAGIDPGWEEVPREHLAARGRKAIAKEKVRKRHVTKRPATKREQIATSPRRVSK